MALSLIVAGVCVVVCQTWEGLVPRTPPVVVTRLQSLVTAWEPSPLCVHMCFSREVPCSALLLYPHTL